MGFKGGLFTTKHDAILLQKFEANKERFMKYVIVQDDGCWTWSGMHVNGRPRMSVGGRGHIAAARAAYLLHKNLENVEGLIVCHTCDNALCVNPEHLFTGTSKDNTRDMLKKKRGGMQKITEDDVLQIYKKSIGGSSNISLAKEYNISECTVSNILHGRNWTWLYDKYLNMKG